MNVRYAMNSFVDRAVGLAMLKALTGQPGASNRQGKGSR
jgi:hypothetical protein